MSVNLSYGGADTLTPFQVLGRVQRETGLRIRVSREIHLVEDLNKISATDTVIKMVFTVQRFRSTRRGRVLVEEGVRGCVLVKVADRWSVATDVTSVHAVDGDQVEEIFHGRVETADETVERTAYEEMCHRPGSSRYPMDTASRVEQKRRLGI